ncbi:hypothetical protein [Actinoallomurus sp. CA-150999]|uniref:hypothetical protein n=1 Tax=Actinoallomurus sp. CA-150999 TaxID=3239887 RepID=UPI003D949F71
MPGQRKRKRRREELRRRARAAYEERAGRWEVVFQTCDEAEWEDFRRRFASEFEVTDPSMVRIDMFCGRLVQPTTYRMSVFVPASE